MTSPRRPPPSSLAHVPKQAVRRSPPPGGPFDPNAVNRRMALWLGGALVVLLLLTLIVLGIGPFSRPGPSPTPFTGVGSPSPSTSGSGSTSPGPTDTAADATPTPTPRSTPTSTPSSSASTAPPSSAPPTSPPPTTPPGTRPFLGARVSGPIELATKGVLVRALLTPAQVARYKVAKQGPVHAGSVLGDFSSFAASHGRAVVWQSWLGKSAVRQISDVRMAFPTTDDATAFVAKFGDQVKSSAGLTEGGPVKIGEQTRLLRSDTADSAGIHTVRIVYIFRRGDLVGVAATVIVARDPVGARNRATVIAERAGLDLDQAVGIVPGQ
jgi:hypothetical protein